MRTKEFTIAILEDQEFFNKLLTQKVTYHTKDIIEDLGCKIQVQSYVSAIDFINNIPSNTDIAFVDYYLGNGINAGNLVKEIKKKCPECKVVILSRLYNFQTSIKTISDGAFEFIYKDREVLNRSCTLIDDVLGDEIRYT